MLTAGGETVTLHLSVVVVCVVLLHNTALTTALPEVRAFSLQEVLLEERMDTTSESLDEKLTE